MRSVLKRLLGLSVLAMLFGASLALFMGAKPIRSENAPGAENAWAAAAPGRIEPRWRELRIAAPVPAVIKEVYAGLNDRVKKGDLLIRLDDDEQTARLDAAEAQVAARIADRDTVKVSEAAKDRRKAEDALYKAESDAFDARMTLDRLIADTKLNKGTAADVEKARAAVKATSEKEHQERDRLRKLLAKDPPALKREDAAVTAARADVAVARASLERMRIRAPLDAAVFDVKGRAGEIAGSGGAPLLRLGDPDHLQVRAEVDERDISKITAGQSAAVKSEAFADRVFEAKVASIGRALAAPQLSSPNRRQQSDFDVLEVVLNLEEGEPLLPGMRVDVMFREPAAKKSSAANAQ